MHFLLQVVAHEVRGAGVRKGKEVPAHAHLQPSFLLTLALSAGDHLCCNAASTFSAVMGKSWIRTPTAS